MPDSTAPFEGWCVLELLGHRRLGGYVREVEMFGAKLLRIDIPLAGALTAPGADEIAVPAGERTWEATQYYSSAALYGLTPCSAEAALAVARANRPAPVTCWELPDRRSEARHGDLDEGDDDGPEDRAPF